MSSCTVCIFKKQCAVAAPQCPMYTTVETAKKAYGATQGPVYLIEV